MKSIQEKLKKMQDAKFASFQNMQVPTFDGKKIIGIKTPALKKIAKELLSESDVVEKFLNELPHIYFEEMQLHAFILSEMKNYDLCINEIEKFLPYIDNWGTCDQLCPKTFPKNKKDLLKHIKIWIKSDKAYTVRFAMKCLMQYFLDEDFDEKYLKWVADVHFPYKNKTSKYKPNTISVNIDPDKYYVEMMIAWYFATALAKQYKEALPYIKNKKLITWTHNKTIQKSIESFRVSESHKKELKKLKINN